MVRSPLSIDASRRYQDKRDTHIFNLFDGKVGVGGYTDMVLADIDDHHHWFWDESFEDFVNLLVRRS